MEQKKAAELTARQAEVLMAAVIIARSTSFVIAKMAVNSMASFNILALRFLLAFVILLVIFRRKVRSMQVGDLRSGFLLGVTYTAVMGFEMTGIRYAESSMASLIENSAFMLVPVLEILFLHILPKKIVVAGMAISFAGLLVLNLGAGSSLNGGSAFLFAAMFFYALAILETSVFAKRADPLLVGIVQIGTMGVLSLIISLIFEDFQLPPTPSAYLMILILAVVCSVFGFTFQPVAQRSLDPDRAGMFSVLNPLAAIVWGRIFLSEPITANKIIGAALILFGILLPNLVKRRSVDNA